MSDINTETDISLIIQGRGVHTFGRNASGQVITDTCVINSSTYVQTYTRDANGIVTGYSDWVKQ